MEKKIIPEMVDWLREHYDLEVKDGHWLIWCRDCPRGWRLKIEAGVGLRFLVNHFQSHVEGTAAGIWGGELKRHGKAL